MGSSNAKLQDLHKAVIEDDATKVRDLLQSEEIDPNCPGEQELTALHVAIAQGSLKSLRVLLECSRVDVARQTRSKQTTLVLATTQGNEDLALHLLESYPSNLLHLDVADSNGLQALHHASRKGQERLVTALLERGVEPDVRGKLNQTPLMLAAENDHTSVVEVLLEAGANCSTVDTARMTPLHYACMGGSEQCAKLLLESNTNVSVDAKDISGCTPLLYCLSNKSRSMEKLLVSHGANLTEALDAGFQELCYHTWQSDKS